MIKNNIILRLLRYRSRQLRLERERRRALEETNSILSAYIAFLIDGSGGAKIPKDAIRGAIGRYRAKVDAVGSDYIIGIERNCESEGRGRGGK